MDPTSIRKYGDYCKPEPGVKVETLQDVDRKVKAATGIQWSFYGMKQADSLQRRLMMDTYDLEAISTKTQKAYPLSFWRDKEVLRYIEARKLPKPINYGSKARSNGVGFDIEVFLWLKRHYPQDLQKIIERFPESEVILKQHYQKQQNENRRTKSGG